MLCRARPQRRSARPIRPASKTDGRTNTRQYATDEGARSDGEDHDSWHIGWLALLTAALLAAATVADAIALQGIDNQQWFAWLQATSEGRDQTANSIAERMRPELKPVFEEWLAIRADDPSNTTVPFDLGSYQLESRSTADQLNRRAAAFAQDAAEFNQRSNNYVLLTVVFASVVFVAALAAMLTFPVSVGF